MPNQPSTPAEGPDALLQVQITLLLSVADDLACKTHPAMVMEALLRTMVAFTVKHSGPGFILTNLAKQAAKLSAIDEATVQSMQQIQTLSMQQMQTLIETPTGKDKVP